MKLRFDECPYNCNDAGEVFDFSIKKRIPCPYCSQKRKELVQEGVIEDNEGDLTEIGEAMGINGRYLSGTLVYDSIIPDGERLFIEEESLNYQSDVLEDIYLGLSVGKLPNQSYCFGVGGKGNIENLVYPLMVKAYMSGISVAKFTSCNLLNQLYLDMSDEYKDYLHKDLVIVLIPSGASKADILFAKGLMETRAIKNKVTIFVTSWSVEACSSLLGYYGDGSYSKATSCFIKYNVGKKQSKYINNLTGVENDVYIEKEYHNPHSVSMEDLI